MPNSEVFSLEFLELVNEWQSGPPTERLQQIGEELSKLSKELDPFYRTEDACCYRRIDLDKTYIWQLAKNRCLDAHYGSWSLSIDVVKIFNAGVPPKGIKTGVIFHANPSAHNVVVNLSRLYNNTDFLNACFVYRDKIKNYGAGIGAFGNRESEIIIHVKSLPISSVFAFGGYSHSIDELIEFAIGHPPTDSEIIFFTSLLARNGRQAGANWITENAVDRTIVFLDKAYEALKQYHK